MSLIGGKKLSGVLPFFCFCKEASKLLATENILNGVADDLLPDGLLFNICL